MRRAIARSLRTAANRAAVQFSNPGRARSNGDAFKVGEITVLSEISAAVIFDKSPSGKKAVGFFYYLNPPCDRWEYFFATYNHIAGLERVRDILFHVEQHNFEPDDGIPF